MKRCETCDEWIVESLFVSHKCNPQWLVYDPADVCPDDARVIFAHDAEDAAERYCEDSDCGSAEYEYLRSSGCDLIIVIPGEGNEGEGGRFRVSAEACPSYSATQLKAEVTNE
jgi:hypothetical protein